EIDKLRGAVTQKSYTLVPTKIYFRQGLVKLEIGLAKGKELHDKRRSIADKDSKRQLDRTIKEYNNR
ncbi:MAG: SsrA-binding protein, partial [Clostridia bacterium]|nr:SsrA-binding protein [Clostridia bacterium]